jgi:hypothetical protein
MRRLPLIAALLLAAPVVAMVGCDPTTVEDLARKVVFDPTSVAYTAVREFNADYGGQPIHWTERVLSAGDGATILVELLEINGKTRDEITDPVELAAFDRLAAQLTAGGGSRALFQRDPIPEDLDRLIDNYYITVVEIGRERKLGNEPSLTYRIEPVHADRPFYVLTASTRAGREGFPIECQEYVVEATGPRLVSLMRVRDVKWGKPADFDPPASPIVSRTELDSLDTARSRASANGLALFLPLDTSLPPGFELVKVEEVQMQTDANAARNVATILLYRFVYSDGVERIDFIEHAPPDNLPPTFLYGFNGHSVDLALIARFGTITTGAFLHSDTLVTIESRIAAERFEPMLKALVRL